MTPPNLPGTLIGISLSVECRKQHRGQTAALAIIAGFLCFGVGLWLGAP